MPLDPSIVDLTEDPPRSTVESRHRHTPALLKSTKLAGKTFVITGAWITMSVEHAKDLCKANSGTVVTTFLGKADYIVVGARGTHQDTSTYIQGGAKLLSEKAFLGMILDDDKENQPSGAGQKRAADSDAAGPSKRAKAARKSDPGPGAAPAEPPMTHLNNFLYHGEVRVEKKSLTAYDRGGEVYKAQRGKSAVALLTNFNQWLEDCDGEYHYLL